MIASGKSAKQFYDYPYRERGWKIIALNNVWQYLDVNDFDLLIHAADVRPKHIPSDKRYMFNGPPYMERWGGSDKAGRGVVITSAYYVFEKFEPEIMGFLGCDMNYTPDPDTGNTCVYGIGKDIRLKKISDPDRILKLMKDPDYFNKVWKLFEEQTKCEAYNFSDDPDTRLPLKQVNPEDIDRDE